MSKTRHWICYVFLSFHWIFLATSTKPVDRKDVIGLHTLAYEEQCRTLCWYRLNCTSYSYRHTSVPSRDHNCVLHTDLVARPAVNPVNPASGWKENPATGLYINNGCNARPCTHKEVCVPRSSTSALFVCLSLPAQCGFPVVPHGGAITNGTSQDDVGNVTCNEGYVASPRGVPVGIVCLVTSRWTGFAGKCKQFEFVFETSKLLTYTPPWGFQENSEVCFKGNFPTEGRIRIRLSPTFFHVEELRVLFAYKFNNAWYGTKVSALVEVGRKDRIGHFHVGENHLLPGDSFNITIRLLRDELQLVLNAAHTYNISLDHVHYRNGSKIDIGSTRIIQMDGDVSVSYVNLLKGC